MIRHRYMPFLVLLCWALGDAPVLAQERPRIGLDEALRMLVANNLELRVARSRVDQAAGLARQAGAFPNPTLGATHEPLSGGPGAYSETYVTLSQRIEVGGSRGARAAAADGRWETTVHRYAADSLRLAFSTKRAYALASAASQRRTMAERVAGVFRDAERSARERYESGDIALYALRRIEIERARYEMLLADAEIELDAAELALALLVAPADASARFAVELLPTAPPTLPTGIEIDTSIERRPELAAARAEAVAGAGAERLARAERVPDVTATGGFKRQSDDRRGAFLGLSLPLPLFDRGSGAVAAAGAERRAAEEQLDLTRRQLAHDVEGARATYDVWARRAALSTAAPEGEDLLDIALVAYEEGEMELVELLDAAEALHDATRDRLRTRTDLWIAYFDLERALGGFGPALEQEDDR